MSLCKIGESPLEKLLPSKKEMEGTQTSAKTKLQESQLTTAPKVEELGQVKLLQILFSI